MKALATLSLAVAALTVPLAASAQTRVPREHAQTASALACLLEHRQGNCSHAFVGSATRPAAVWLRQNPNRDFALGDLVSSEYVGTQSVNAYLTRFLHAREADVYAVKYRHQEKTFYIVPPGPDGTIHYLMVRQGGPQDEREELFVAGPG
jgi:hypothetical protein